jgi:hypothetical protein
MGEDARLPYLPHAASGVDGKNFLFGTCSLELRALISVLGFVR